MKTKEEIEQLAEKFHNKSTSNFEIYLFHIGFIDGYTQCQEDNKNKKYTEEDIINIVKKSRETGLTAEYLILQLNKQD
jgi:hypothetical protein